MKTKSKVRKMLNQYFDDYMSINLNGGWERYCKNVEEYKQDLENLTYEEIKELRKKKQQQLDSICDSLSD